MTADEVRKDVEARLKKVETFNSRLGGGLALTALLVGVAVALSFNTLSAFVGGVLKTGTDVAVLNAKVPELAASHAELQKKHAELVAEYNRLRTRLIVVIDRAGGRPVPEALVHWGKVLWKKGAEIALLPDDRGELAFVAPLAADVSVRSQFGKKRTMADVKEGEEAGVFLQGGKAIEITVK